MIGDKRCRERAIEYGPGDGGAGAEIREMQSPIYNEMARVGLIKNIEKGVFAARASVTKNHKLSALNNRNLLSHSSGGCKSAIKVSAVLVPSEDWNRRWEGESVPGLSPWLVDGHLLSTSSHHLPSMHVSVPTFPLFIRIQVILD